MMTVETIKKALMAWHYDLMIDVQRTSRTLDESEWLIGAQKIAAALDTARLMQESAPPFAWRYAAIGAGSKHDIWVVSRERPYFRYPERYAVEPLFLHPSVVQESAPEPSLNMLARHIHTGENRKWWVTSDGAPIERNKGVLLMLVVTEVSEAMEGERKNLMDDKLPHRRMAEVEIADAIARLLDYAAASGFDLDTALAEKRAYNATRADHKAEALTIDPYVIVSKMLAPPAAALPPEQEPEK